MSRGRRQRNSRKWVALSRMMRSTHPWCELCGSTQDLTVDHKIPLSQGGATYDPENLQVLCRICNSSKGTTTEPGDSLTIGAPCRPLPAFSLPPGTPPFRKPSPVRDSAL